MGILIGVSGKARSGKDSLFNMAENNGFRRLSFAEDLKSRGRKDFGLTAEYTDGASKDEMTTKLNGHSPREFFIELGNLYRKYDPDFWLRQAVAKAKEDPTKDWMVTDVRYPNEADAIKKLGGLVIRLERHASRDNMVSDEVKASLSETALDSYERFDAVCKAENNGDLIDLAYFWVDVLALIKALEQNKKTPSQRG